MCSVHVGVTGSIAICVSPLTSLMMDQHSKYSPRRLSTEFIGEAQHDPKARQRVLDGEAQLVFITPESIMQNKAYRNMLLSPPYQERLVALVVDEAHCIKTLGDEFRTVYSEIGNLRSLIPNSVHILAVTATATTETFHVVSKRLSMDHPYLVALPPIRDNIPYTILAKVDIDELTTSLCEEFAEKRGAFPKTVIYVRTYSDCSGIYMLMKAKLGSRFTEPPDYPHVSKFRVIDMFTRVLTTDKKEQVLQSFSEKDGVLRLIIATTAFGMGIDCPDIRRIIHWGIPSTLEEYIQETGRCGRDGNSAAAVLYQGKGGKNASSKVKNYVSNTTVCRHRLLFQQFLLYNSDDIKVRGEECCDICGT